jgi:hypothetical protein
MDSGMVTAIFVGVIAAAMIVVAIAAMIFVLSFRKYCDRLEATVNQITRDVQPVLVSAREAIAEGREKVNAISANVIDITNNIRGQVARVDTLLTDASERAKVQVARIDQMLTDTVSRVEETGQAVRQSVMTPVREVSAILTGVRTSLDVLFHRQQRVAVEQATQDEELFI